MPRKRKVKEPQELQEPQEVKAERPRSIRLPDVFWDALADDARRCKRSSQKQLEAILATLYNIEDVEISKDAIQEVRFRTHAESA